MTVRVCLASQLFHPYYAGGALRYMRYLPGLAQRDIEITVFTGTPSTQRSEAFAIENRWGHLKEGYLLPTTYVNDTPVFRVRLPDERDRRRGLAYGTYLQEFLQQASTKFDLVQFLPLPLWVTPSAWRLKRQKIPVIATYNLISNNQFSKWSYTTFKQRLPLQVVNTVVVQTALMKDKLQTMGVKSEIEVIPNGVDLKRFHPAKDQQEKNEIRRSLGFTEEDLLLLMVGSVEPRKGIDRLLAAWNEFASELENVHLIIAGPRPDLENPQYASFRKQLDQLVKISGAAARIHFVGNVDDITTYYKAADIFTFSSKREGLPNVVLEAMASRLPVITWPFIGLSSELGHPGKQYCLVDGDVTQYGQQLKLLLLDAEKREKLGHSAYEWVLQQMNIDHMLDRYANLYRQLSHQN